MKFILLLTAVLALTTATSASGSPSVTARLIPNVGGVASIAVSIAVADLTTGHPIVPGQTVNNGDSFQVTVTTNGTNCAGQFVVTALGAPGAPPSVLVQVVPYIVGPASGGNSVTGNTLTAGGTGNEFKVSTSCDGVHTGQVAYSSFEFRVR